VPSQPRVVALGRSVRPMPAAERRGQRRVFREERRGGGVLHTHADTDRVAHYDVRAPHPLRRQAHTRGWGWV
jgi:hypothetical protein